MVARVLRFSTLSSLISTRPVAGAIQKRPCAGRSFRPGVRIPVPDGLSPYEIPQTYLERRKPPSCAACGAAGPGGPPILDVALLGDDPRELTLEVGDVRASALEDGREGRRLGRGRGRGERDERQECRRRAEDPHVSR